MTSDGRSLSDTFDDITKVDRIRPFFDARYYLAQYPDIAAAGMDALEHYVLQGWRERRRPAPDFDPDYYLAAYPEVRDADIDPFLHYIEVGREEGRLARAPEQRLSDLTEHARIERLREAIDLEFYLARYPDVAASGMDPVFHYARHGFRERRKPAPDFDPDYYLSSYPDVREADVDPFLHFIVIGKAEGRLPQALDASAQIAPRLGDEAAKIERLQGSLDVRFYLAKYPDIAGSGMDPVFHYVRHGWRERRWPAPDFNPDYYLTAYPDVREAGVDPFLHYLEFGRDQGRRPHASDEDASAIDDESKARVALLRQTLDVEYYLAAYPDVALSGMDAVVHYFCHGWKEQRRPAADFDPKYYLEAHPEVREARLDPFLHFLEIGREQGWSPRAPELADVDDDRPRLARLRKAMDVDYYLLRYPDIVLSGMDPVFHYFHHGWREGRHPTRDFDPDYYLDAYPDVRDADINPFLHYLEFGRRLGRLPRAPEKEDPAVVEKAREQRILETLRLRFDAEFYLARYPDIAASGMDPLEHYCQHGWREKRNPNRNFDSAYYLSANRDVRGLKINPFFHYLTVGLKEGRPPKRPRPFRRQLRAADPDDAPRKFDVWDLPVVDTSISSEQLSAALEVEPGAPTPRHDCYVILRGRSGEAAWPSLKLDLAGS